MRCEKHIIYIEKGGQARILFLECGLVRFFYGMTKAFLALTKASVGDIFPFLGVHAIILINFSFSRKANAKNRLDCWQLLSRCFLEKVGLCLNIRIEFRKW